MSDLFRIHQKRESVDDSPGQKSNNGCPCCRKYGNLNKHRKYARRKARVKLKRRDRKELHDSQTHNAEG